MQEKKNNFIKISTYLRFIIVLINKVKKNIAIMKSLSTALRLSCLRFITINRAPRFNAHLYNHRLSFHNFILHHP